MVAQWIYLFVLHAVPRFEPRILLSSKKIVSCWVSCQLGMAQRCRLKDTRTVKVKNKNKDKKLLKSRTGGLGTALLVIISMYQCRSHSTPGPNLQTSFILMASVTVLPCPTYRPYKLTPPLPPVGVRLWPTVIATLASLLTFRQLLIIRGIGSPTCWFSCRNIQQISQFLLHKGFKSGLHITLYPPGPRLRGIGC